MSYRTHDSSGGCAAVIALALILGIGLVVGITKANTAHNEVLTVQEKDRVCDGGKNGTCRYLIFTAQGVYENTDTLFAGKWNSSDIQSQLKPGHTYEVEVRGWRVPFVSSYPNVVKIQREVTK